VTPFRFAIPVSILFCCALADVRKLPIFSADEEKPPSPICIFSRAPFFPPLKIQAIPRLDTVLSFSLFPPLRLRSSPHLRHEGQQQ